MSNFLYTFQYKYATTKDLACIYVGILGALVTGAIPALSTWIFGSLVDVMQPYIGNKARVH